MFSLTSHTQAPETSSEKPQRPVFVPPEAPAEQVADVDEGDESGTGPKEPEVCTQCLSRTKNSPTLAHIAMRAPGRSSGGRCSGAQRTELSRS